MGASKGGAPAGAKFGIFTINHGGGIGECQVWIASAPNYGNLNHVVKAVNNGTYQFIAPIVNGTIYFHTKCSGQTQTGTRSAGRGRSAPVYKNSGRLFSIYGMGWI